MFESIESHGDFPHVSIFVTFDPYFYPEGEGPNEDIPQGEDYWVPIDEVPVSYEQIWDEDLPQDCTQEVEVVEAPIFDDLWSDFTEVRTSGDILSGGVSDDLPNPHYNGPTSHTWRGACGRHGRKVAAKHAVHVNKG